MGYAAIIIVGLLVAPLLLVLILGRWSGGRQTDSAEKPPQSDRGYGGDSRSEAHGSEQLTGSGSLDVREVYSDNQR